MDKKIFNKLLEKLGAKNLTVTDKPTFHWNGNCVTTDTTAPVKTVSTYVLRDNFTFNDFLIDNSNSKIVFYSVEDNRILAFVDA